MTPKEQEPRQVKLYQPPDPPQPVAMHDRILELAIQQGAPLDQLEKYLDIKSRHEAEEAKKAFYQAVADFKSEKIVVTKDKKNTQFKSQYTSLGNLLNTVNPILGRHGLSVSFDLVQQEKMITVSCILRHRLGHTEKVELSAPPDTSGGSSKNMIQQIKSTITYLRAATFEAVTGLASTDANLDDDGQAAYQPVEKKELKPENEQDWQNALNAYQRDGNFLAIEKYRTISDENKKRLVEDCGKADCVKTSQQETEK